MLQLGRFFIIQTGREHAIRIPQLTTTTQDYKTKTDIIYKRKGNASWFYWPPWMNCWTMIYLGGKPTFKRITETDSGSVDQ